MGVWDGRGRSFATRASERRMCSTLELWARTAAPRRPRSDRRRGGCAGAARVVLFHTGEWRGGGARCRWRSHKMAEGSVPIDAVGVACVVEPGGARFRFRGRAPQWDGVEATIERPEGAAAATETVGWPERILKKTKRIILKKT